MLAKDQLVRDLRLQRDIEIWQMRTGEAMTQEQIAEHFGIDQSTVSRRLSAIAKKGHKKLQHEVVVELMAQIEQLRAAAAEAWAAWKASKEGDKKVNSTTYKESYAEVDADGKEVIKPGGRVLTTTTRAVGETYGDIRFLREYRGCLEDLRQLLDLMPDKRLKIRWEDTLPPGVTPDEARRQFAEAMAVMKTDDSEIAADLFSLN